MMRYIFTVISLMTVNFLYGQEIQSSQIIDSIFIVSNQDPSSNSENQVAVKGKDLLQLDHNVYLPNNSVNGLILPRLEGMKGDQIDIVWNGWRINDQMNGVFDLRLLPFAFYKNAEVNNEWSSGFNAVSSINLDSSTDNELQILGGSLGSFGQKNWYSNLSAQPGRFSLNTKLDFMAAENDFSFTNYTLANPTTEKLRHASFKNRSIEQSIEFAPSNKEKISLIAWWQKSNREIPPSILSNFSNAIQLDESFRISGQYENLSGDFEIAFAYFNTQNEYIDQASQIFGNHITNNYLARLTKTISTNSSSRLKIGAEWLNAKANSTNLTERAIRNQQQVWLNYEKNFSRINLQLESEINSLITDFKNIDFLPKLKLSYTRFNIIPHFELAWFFRNPTLNEWYWNPGGNPELLPENGITTRMAFDIPGLWKNHSIKAGVFSHYLDHQISWLPLNSIWSPMNLTDVWNRGFTIKYSIQKNFNNSKALNFTSVYSYTKSTRVKSDISNDAGLHKQLAFVPQDQWITNIDYKQKNWKISSQIDYTGKRFIDLNNAAFLDDFLLINLQLDRKLKLDETTFYLTFRLDNLLNQYYEHFPYQPMPGISYLTSLKIEL